MLATALQVFKPRCDFTKDECVADQLRSACRVSLTQGSTTRNVALPDAYLDHTHRSGWAHLLYCRCRVAQMLRSGHQALPGMRFDILLLLTTRHAAVTDTACNVLRLQCNRGALRSLWPFGCRCVQTARTQSLPNGDCTQRHGMSCATLAAHMFWRMVCRALRRVTNSA